MKSIWKKAALAVLAGAMAFSFTGCGGEKKAEAPAAKKESKEITVYIGSRRTVCESGCQRI